MATSQEELILLLKLKDEMSHGVGSMHSSLTGLGSTLLSVGSKATIGLGAVAVAAAGMVAVTGIQFSAMKEQSQIAFTTMLKSGETAKMFLDELQRFAAKTPFEFEDLTRGSRRLMAMGTAAKDVLPTLTIIGDAAAGLSAGKEGIDAMITALSQMGMAGKVSSQDMMQLTNVGVAGWRYLAEEAGVSVAVIRKRAEEGALDSTKAVQTILAGMNKDFGGMMDRQSASFSGMVSTFKDTFKIISGDVMKPFFTEIAKGMKSLVDYFETPQFKNAVEQMTLVMQDAGTKIVAEIKKIINWFIENREQIWKNLKYVFEVIKEFVTLMAWAAKTIGEHKVVLIAIFVALGVAIVASLGPASTAFLAVAGILTLIGAARRGLASMAEAKEIRAAAKTGLTDDEIERLRETSKETGISVTELAGRTGREGATIGGPDGATSGYLTILERGSGRRITPEEYQSLARANRAVEALRGAGDVDGRTLQERLAALGGGSGGGGGTPDGGGGKKDHSKPPFTAADLQFIDDLLGRLPAVADSLNKIAPPAVVDALTKAQKELAEGTISLTSAQLDQLNAVREYDREVLRFSSERDSLSLQLADVKSRMLDLDNAGKTLSPEFIALTLKSDVLKAALEKVDFVQQLRLDPLKDKMAAVRSAITETINAEEALAAKRRQDAQDLIKQLWAANPNQSPESAVRAIGIANKAVADSANMAALIAKGYTAEQAASLTNAGVLAKNAVIPQGSPGAEDVTVKTMKVEVVASPDFTPKGTQ